MATVVASKTLTNTISVYDKNKILSIDSWGIYRDEACTDSVSSGLIEDSVYYVLVYGKNAYDPLDVNYSPTLTINLANGYGTGTCNFYSIVTDNSTYKKGKYKLILGEFSYFDNLNGIDGNITDSNNAYLGYQLPAQNTIWNYIVKSNIIPELDYFKSVIVDNDGNYIAVGFTYIDSQGYNDAIIVKLDSNLTILDANRYSGDNDDYFHSIVIDNDGNYVAVGFTYSEGQGNSDALIVKFDSNLNIIAAKIYGGYNNDYFDFITVDNYGNYIVIGNTASEGQGSNDALIVKFNSDLNIIAAKIYGGNYYDYFESVKVDNNGNYIVVGNTFSEGQGNSDALIVKFDSNLNILAAKIYGGSDIDSFESIVIDNSGNYIIAGYTRSEGQGNIDALIVKFNSDLNIIAAKTYGGSDDDSFYNVAVDDDGNYITVGDTFSEGQGSNNALIVKFNNNLTISNAKIYGKSNLDYFYDIIIGNDGNYIAVGNTYFNGSYCGLISKISYLPSGAFTSNLGYVFDDSNLTLTNSNLTLANSNLTFANVSNFILADSNLMLLNISYTKTEDKILG